MAAKKDCEKQKAAAKAPTCPTPRFVLTGALGAKRKGLVEGPLPFAKQCCVDLGKKLDRAKLSSSRAKQSAKKYWRKSGGLVCQTTMNGLEYTDLKAAKAKCAELKSCSGIAWAKACNTGNRYKGKLVKLSLCEGTKAQPFKKTKKSV